MFFETSYPGCGLSGLSGQAEIEARLAKGKKVKQAKLDKFGIVAPPSYTTLPVPKVKVPKGPIIAPPQTPFDAPEDMGLMPAMDPGAAEEAGGGGFDLGGIGDIFSALPWWAWALGAYFLLKKR